MKFLDDHEKKRTVQVAILMVFCSFFLFGTFFL